MAKKTSISKKNIEGYPDPTAYEALMNIEREAQKTFAFRPVVYICSPLSGDIDANQEAARRYCRYAVDSGYVPIAPHLFFPQFMDDDFPGDRRRALEMGLEMLRVADELWVCGYIITSGMRAEIEEARRLGKFVRYIVTNDSFELTEVEM